MTAAKPSLELLRTLTDEHVLRELMQARRLTRADLAARSGLSKPTVGESVRRLTEAGLVVDTGERTPGGRGRGRVGSYYALADTVGTALVIGIAPDGVVAECVDAYGDTLARRHHEISRPARPEQVAAALRTAAIQAQRSTGRATRLAVVSAADPVQRTTGRLIRLPDAPFLLGELDPVDVLAPQVQGPVVVDNDVNWAAQAERDTDPTTLTDFAYLYLGEGLGCAVVSDGQVRRGHAGLAGEIAHLITIGPDGRATRFIEVFGDLGLRRTRQHGDRRRPAPRAGRRVVGHPRGDRSGGERRPGRHRRAHRPAAGRPRRAVGPGGPRRRHRRLRPPAPARRPPRGPTDPGTVPDRRAHRRPRPAPLGHRRDPAATTRLTRPPNPHPDPRDEHRRRADDGPIEAPHCRRGSHRIDRP